MSWVAEQAVTANNTRSKAGLSQRLLALLNDRDAAGLLPGQHLPYARAYRPKEGPVRLFLG